MARNPPWHDILNMLDRFSYTLLIVLLVNITAIRAYSFALIDSPTHISSSIYSYSSASPLSLPSHHATPRLFACLACLLLTHQGVTNKNKHNHFMLGKEKQNNKNEHAENEHGRDTQKTWCLITYKGWVGHGMVEK